MRHPPSSSHGCDAPAQTSAAPCFSLSVLTSVDPVHAWQLLEQPERYDDEWCVWGGGGVNECEYVSVCVRCNVGWCVHNTCA